MNVRRFDRIPGIIILRGTVHTIVNNVIGFMSGQLFCHFWIREILMKALAESELDERLPRAAQTRLLGFSQNIWEQSTSAKYNSMHEKWLYLCRVYDRSSAQPTQADINAYIAWLETTGSWAEKHDWVGLPMKFRSVESCLQGLGLSLRALHRQEYVISDSVQTHWVLHATKRMLGDTQQRLLSNEAQTTRLHYFKSWAILPAYLSGESRTE